MSSPLHLLLVKYIIAHARALRRLVFNQLQDDFEESLIESFLSWNPMLNLEEFEVSRAVRLSLLTLNLLIERCPRLKRVGRLGCGGGVEKREIDALRKELKRRNVELEIE